MSEKIKLKDNKIKKSIVSKKNVIIKGKDHSIREGAMKKKLRMGLNKTKYFFLSFFLPSFPSFISFLPSCFPFIYAAILIERFVQICMPKDQREMLMLIKPSSC